MPFDTDTTCREPAATELDVDALAGWQLLAGATLDRLLTDDELETVERMPAEDALAVLFPHLTDAARHEALWALG